MDEISTLGSMGSVLRELAAAPSDLLVRGTVVDEQYEIERVIGSGAMGVVYLARDRRLERNVALKLVRDQTATALARASREAVALARLSHPNVVVIHQVGELAGQVYVAMEYVAGGTAREWAAQRRSLAEILDVYLEVGEGLAAAHAAGLVHRDFKPDNVLVGADGRARVADFGLARSPATGEALQTVGNHTQVAGTPAYMAPEQLRGEVIDARADQFAYCTSLWEAMHGRRPFHGATPDEMRQAIERGEPADSDRKVPRHVDLALRRGLAADRDARWPDVAQLLAELRRDPARHRRNVALAIALPAIALGVFAVTRSAKKADDCDVDSHAIRWNATRATELAAKLAPANSAAWIGKAAHATTDSLDQFSAQWSASYLGVCRSGWSASLHDRGTVCLARAEHALSATLDTLATPNIDPAKLDGVVATLPRPQLCTDPVYLAADVPPPANPALAAVVLDAETELHAENTLAAAGITGEIEKRLEKLEQLVIDYPPLVANIHLHRAVMAWGLRKADAARQLSDTYFEARMVGARATAAKAAVDLAALELDDSHDADAATWSQLAAVEASDLADPELAGTVLDRQAIVATAQNNNDHAIELLTRGIAILHGTYSVCQLLADRGDAYDKLGKGPLALADYDAALKLLADRFGEFHPQRSVIEQERSLALVHLGRIDDAIAAARHAVAIAAVIDTTHSYSYPNAEGALGVALTAGHQYAEALELLDRSLAGDIANDGARSYNVASDRNNRCELLTHMGRYAEAIADCKLADAIWLETVGPDSTEAGQTASNLAGAELSNADYEGTISAADKAIKLLSAHGKNPLVIVPLVTRASANREAGHFADARKDLEAASADIANASPDVRSELSLELAYVEAHDHHVAKAKELAATARDGFAALKSPRAAEASTLLGKL